MRIYLPMISFAFFLLPPCYVSVQASQASVTPPTMSKDAQAVSILSQTLAISGGAQAVAAVADYKGTGNITYHSDHDQQGTVTVSGLLGGSDIRIDASVSSGVRSWAVCQGVTSTRDENGDVISLEPKTSVPSSDAFPYQTPLFPTSIAFPSRQLVAVLSSPAFSIAYNGVTQIDGHSVHDIEFSRLPNSSSTPRSFTLPGPSREIFIDTSTFQVVMTKETLPKGVIRQVHYSNFQLVNGLLMALTVSEDIASQPTWTIQFTQFNFNTGLQESSCALQ
jgi:hypothetical protein